MNAPRVLLWSPSGAGDHYHGPGSFACRLYRSAAPGTVDVELAHAFADQRPMEPFRAVHRTGVSPTGAVGLARYLHQSRRWLRAHARQFDVVHALSGFHSSFMPAIEAERLGVPAVLFVTLHGHEFTDKGTLKDLVGLARMRRRRIGELSAIVAMSNAIHRELLELGVAPDRIARIPMGIDTDRFAPAAASQRLARRHELGFPDMPTLAFVGGISARKRPHLLVQAIGRLACRGMDCQLVLAGPVQEPDYAAAMRSEAERLGIDRNVHWLGHTTSIESVYQAADVFALPSSMEGMPAALLEAMASGLPALVTTVSGCEDLVSDRENGRLVAPTVDDIAAALSSYLADPALAAAHGARARQIALERHSNQIVLDAYLRLFQAVRTGLDPASASVG